MVQPHPETVVGRLLRSLKTMELLVQSADALPCLDTALKGIIKTLLLNIRHYNHLSIFCNTLSLCK